MIQNGYLEFKEDKNYEIYDDTKDYYTGLTFKEFNTKNKEIFILNIFKSNSKIDDYETNEVNDKKI